MCKVPQVTPVPQTSYGKGLGNCLTACVASVLDVPIGAVPEFCQPADGLWFNRLYSFCLDSGFSLVYWRHSENVPVLCLNSYVILLLVLEGEEDMHAVVAKSSLKRISTEEPRSDKQVESDFEASEVIGSPRDSVRWEWESEVVHDPNQRGYPPVKEVYGYLMIGRQ